MEDMSLLSEVFDVSPRRESKADIIDYYRQEYGRGWKQQLVHGPLSELTGMKPKNLERRFDPSRINNPEARNAEQYRELGDLLPPMTPEGGYHITGTVWVKFSDGQCEEREVDEEITGDEARALLKAAIREAYEEMEDMVLNHYMTDSIDDSEHVASYGDCQAPRLHAEAIE